MKLIDLVGRKFGRLTVIKRVKNGKIGEPRWFCECECGNTKVVLGKHLRGEGVKHCGCSRIPRTFLW